MSTLAFIIFAVVLAIILVAVSLLLDPMLGIFIVCLIACILLNKDNIKNTKATKTKTSIEKEA